MLTVKYVGRIPDKFEILNSFDCSIGTWVVPDLVSKQSVQRQLLENRKLVEDDSCLRVSDLWRKLLFYCRPEMRIISPSLVNCLVNEWLSESQFEWARHPGACGLMQKYLLELMPLLSHPESEHLVPEWFRENPSAFIRWGLWYQEAKRIWEKFDAQGLTSKEWISGFLVNEENIDRHWKRPLVFDLGVEVLASEIDLIKNLSRYLDITVLVPTPKWISEYPELAARYNALKEYLPKLEEVVESWKPKVCEYRVFPSALGEVKDAVAEVQGWIEQGVSPQKIAILSPNKKLYASCLSEFLTLEGIPFQKRNEECVSADANIARWVSRLNLISGNLDSGSLEMDLYFTQKPCLENVSYDDFRIQYSHLYGPGDLRRNPKVKQAYSQTVDVAKNMSREEFIVLILKSWDVGWNQDSLERVLQSLIQDAPEWLELSVAGWFHYLFDLVRYVDFAGASNDSHGVVLENIFNAEYLKLSHIYILGTCDSLLRQPARTGINDQDIQSLSRFAGFSLSRSDVTYGEFVMKWLADANHKKMIISYGRANMNGKQEAPAALWIQGRLGQGLDVRVMNTAGTTRWDEIQNTANENLSKILGWQRKYESASLFSRLRMDFNEEQAVASSFTGEIRLSATSLKNYNQCPFVFWSDNLLCLGGDEPLDFDLSFKDISNLLHGALDEFGKRGFPAELPEAAIDQIIDDQIKAKNISIIDWDLWQVQKRSLYSYFKVFLRTESEWRKKFPQTQTLASEISFETFVDLETQKLTGSKAAGGVSITGRIDRVDGDSKGNAMVIDYKRSGSSVTAYGSWLKNRLFQPLLYTLVVENGFTRLGPQNVIGGQFYILKDGDRSKGYYLKDNAGFLFDLSGSARNKITREQKSELLEEMQKVIVTTAKNIRSGNFSPAPSDPSKDCMDCKWRTVCRAPHLL